MNVEWQTIAHKDQRYESSGDWWFSEDGTLHVRGSQMSNPDFEFLEMLHETIEAYLAKRAGVSQQMVDEFDFAYEAAHQRGDPTYPCGCPHLELSDPGSDIHSPYKAQHLIAEAAEAIVARALRVDWRQYDLEAETPPE